MGSESQDRWATEEFGGAALPDRRLVERAVKTGRLLAERPSGTVPEFCVATADATGAYRFLSNVRVRAAALSEAATAATAHRLAGMPFVHVPVDGSSLSFADPFGRREGLGPVGPRSLRGRGLQAMSAYAVRPDGVPVGLLGQRFWSRQEALAPLPSVRRPIADRETRFWSELIDQVTSGLRVLAPGCRPWFQMDRGADAQVVLERMAAPDAGFYATARACQNRTVRMPSQGHLRDLARRLPVAAEIDLQVAERPGRSARVARLVVRVGRITIDSKNSWSKKRWQCTLNFVVAREAGRLPKGVERLEWMLWTNRPIHSGPDACDVISGYATRWAIEEFHRAWKSQCGTEHSRLMNADALTKLAVMTASVAARIEHIKKVSRATPEAPASLVFSRAEIDAVILLAKRSKLRRGDDPPLADFTYWLATLGGHLRTRNQDPPGATVLARALDRISPAVELLSGGM